MGYITPRSYPLRKIPKKDGGHTGFQISIPKEIGNVLPEGIHFQFEVTEDGILMRPSGTERIAPTIETPAWAKGK